METQKKATEALLNAIYSLDIVQVLRIVYNIKNSFLEISPQVDTVLSTFNKNDDKTQALVGIIRSILHPKQPMNLDEQQARQSPCIRMLQYSNMNLKEYFQSNVNGFVFINKANPRQVYCSSFYDLLVYTSSILMYNPSESYFESNKLVQLKEDWYFFTSSIKNLLSEHVGGVFFVVPAAVILAPIQFKGNMLVTVYSFEKCAQNILDQVPKEYVATVEVDEEEIFDSSDSDYSIGSSESSSDEDEEMI